MDRRVDDNGVVYVFTLPKEPALLPSRFTYAYDGSDKKGKKEKNGNKQVICCGGRVVSTKL